MNGLDGLVERAGRAVAARTTRRGFLGQAGRVAVLVAGGSTMVALLEGTASARVCGQTGVSPKCATYDCFDTWGWCWYARGCCADGALKKICDCCAPNTPNPVGYCPSGTRVKCIVESCGADPRLQTKEIRRLGSDDPVVLALAAARLRFPDAPRPVVVLGDAGVAGLAAIGASLTRVADAPLLLTAPHALDGRVAEELRRLRAEFVLLVGGRFSAALRAGLATQGLHVRTVAGSTDPILAAAEAAAWSHAASGARSAVAVMPGIGYEAVAMAGALAGAKGWPLVIGDGEPAQRALRQPRPVARTYVVTDDPADAGRYPGGVAVVGGSQAALAVALADVMVGQAVPATSVALVPVADAVAAAGLAGLGRPLLTYAAGSLDGAWNWLHVHRRSVARAVVAGSVDGFGNRPYYELQSLLNEFEAHLLVGKGGDGLPAISQPRHERPIGKARR